MTSIDESPVLEELTVSGDGSGLEAEKSEGIINAPFDPAQIDVVTQARTVDLLLTRLKEGELDLTPDFQRRANLWSLSRKSSLIESMLLRIPIPSLYVAEDKDGNYTVVDGLQRLCAIAQFVDTDALNKALKTKLVSLRLEGLQALKEYGDMAFVDLPRPLQRRIKETELTLHVIRASTPEDVKFNIFSRINQGGLPLTAQEIRNAIYKGKWRDMMSSLAKSAEFLRATDYRIKAERLEDAELVLRYFAHFALPVGTKRTDDENLDVFLNNTITKVFPTWDDEKWTQASNLFLRSLNYAPRVFGRIAFRKYFHEGERKLPINRGLFESECVVLAKRTQAQLDALVSRQSAVIEIFRYEFEQDEEFRGALLYATGRGRAANKRTETLNRILDGALND